MNDAINKDFQGNSLADFQLEPCPFCGCPVKMQKISIRDGWWYGVACRSSDGYGGSCAMEQVPSRTIEAAAKRWNMRKPMEALIAENERLRNLPTRNVLLKDREKLIDQRNELKAEIAGLKTGYQAYERVNAELKAEVDSLTREADRQYTTIEAYRKDAERFQWLLKNASIIFDKKAAYPAETGFIKFDTMPGRTETESAIDAAMSKEG